MAAQIVVNESIREVVLTALKEQGGPLHPPADTDDFRKKERALLKSLFSNIALQGTSDETVYPDINLDARFNLAHNSEPVLCTYNLHTTINRLKNARLNSDINYIRNLTWRQLCKPFANEAKLGLVMMDELDVHTHLYKEFPDGLDKAPEVAFDFYDGLNYNELRPTQKKAIQFMNNRKFLILNLTRKVDAEIENSGDNLRI
nr:MAG: coat protein [Physalis chlorosis virus]